MANPTELAEERIIDNVHTSLRDNISDPSTYFYPGPYVVRADQYAVGGQSILRPSDRLTYVVRDTFDSASADDLRQFGKDARRMPIFILAAYRDEGAPDPHARQLASAPTRGRIRNRMIHDVITALNQDQSRGGLVFEQTLLDINRDFEEGAGALVLAEITIEVAYEFDYKTP